MKPSKLLSERLKETGKSLTVTAIELYEEETGRLVLMPEGVRHFFGIDSFDELLFDTMTNEEVAEWISRATSRSRA